MDSVLFRGHNICNRGSIKSVICNCSTYGGVIDALGLWNQFTVYLCDDLPRQMQRLQISIPIHLTQPYQDYGFYLLRHHFTDVGKDLEEYQLPLPQHDWVSTLHTNPLIAEKLQYDLDQEQLLGEQRESQLNPNQHIAYTTIINRIATEPTKAQFFFQGPAGTGKTFLYKCICNYF